MRGQHALAHGSQATPKQGSQAAPKKRTLKTISACSECEVIKRVDIFVLGHSVKFPAQGYGLICTTQECEGYRTRQGKLSFTCMHTLHHHRSVNLFSPLLLYNPSDRSVFPSIFLRTGGGSGCRVIYSIARNG